MSDRLTFWRRRRWLSSRPSFAGAAIALAVLAVSISLVASRVEADSGTLDLRIADKTGYDSGLTVDGAFVENIGDSNTTYGSSGSGVFESFLQVQNTPVEAGFNSNATRTLDRGSSPTFNRAVKVSDIPIVTQNVGNGSQQYFELFVDINDSNANDPTAYQLQLVDLEIWFTPDADLTNYPFTGQAGTAKVYDFNGTILLTDVNQGSGRGDVRYSVPVSAIIGGIPANCNYGNPACSTYFTLYSKFGDAGNGDYRTDSGFEEWKVKKYPKLQVSKTIVGTYDQPRTWTIDKTADQTYNLFAGQTSPSHQYAITVTPTLGAAVNTKVSGVITIVGDSESAVTNVTVTDSFAGTGATNVDCDGVAGAPYNSVIATIAKNATVTCTYSIPLNAPVAGTNTATASFTWAPQGGAGQPLSYTGSAAILANAYTQTITGNPSINVSDNNGTPGNAADDRPYGPTSIQATYNYSRTFSCSSDLTAYTNGTYSYQVVNTAKIVETNQSDIATVTVNCYALSVSKTADEAFTTSYDWTLTKYVGLTSTGPWEDATKAVALFNGQNQNYYWKLEWTKGAPQNSGYTVNGTITVLNPAPIAANNVSVTDALSITGAVAVDCDAVTAGNQGTVSIPASSSKVCTYTTAVASDASQVNTATAALGGINYTGTANVSFAGVTPTVVDGTATLNDPEAGQTNQQKSASGSVVSSVQNFACGTSTTINNTATLTEDTSTTQRTDSAALQVTCGGLTVTKTSDESLTRTWAWTINKEVWDPDANSGAGAWVNDLPTKNIDDGQLYEVRYRVKLSASSTDSAWKTQGTITVTNAHASLTASANSITVSDILPGGSNITVDCDANTAGNQNTIPVALAAGASANCTYSVDLPDAAARTNTGRASLYGQNYDGTASVNFTGATVNSVDECVNVEDDMGPAVVTQTLGTHCATTNPTNITLPTTAPNYYTIKFGTASATGEQVTLACGENPTYTNTAKATTNDTTTVITNAATADFNVMCAPGCTLTQGYWKTHSREGKAPYDETWALLPGGLQEDTVFFQSGQTWYQVFWTAPKGNAYYNLAHQYMAAKLNDYNNDAALPAPVAQAISDAETLLAGKTPAQVAALKGNDPVRAQFISLAGTLANFNEGNVAGWPHCDEDENSAP